jgi:hypothetical protein
MRSICIILIAAMLIIILVTCDSCDDSVDIKCPCTVVDVQLYPSNLLEETLRPLNMTKDSDFVIMTNHLHAIGDTIQ